MKNILYSLVFFFVFAAAVYSQVTPIPPMNLPEVFDNSIELPRSAEEGYNMFTDNTFTTLKAPYADKMKLISDYVVKVNDFAVETAREVQSMSSGNVSVFSDTSFEYVNKRIMAVNQEMSDIFMLEVAELGTAQAEFTEHIATVTDKREKLRQLNEYISGKYATICNKYFSMYREKLVTIYALYQETNFASAPVNPLTRAAIAASLIATMKAYVNHKNDIAKGTAERLAKDFIAYRD